MRIISGTHKGRKIDIPKNIQVRPTTDRAKEALFNIINNRYYFQNKTVLDLFAGSGNIGYEFISRGCKNIISVDKNKYCINYIKKTSHKLNLEISTILSDCYEYVLNCDKKFDFVFLDPPYNYTMYNEIKDLIINKKLVKENGCLIIEHDKYTNFDDNNAEFRKYGNVCFSLISF